MKNELSTISYLNSLLINDESQDVKEAEEYLEKNEFLIKNIKINKHY